MKAGHTTCGHNWEKGGHCLREKGTVFRGLFFELLGD